MKIDDYLYHVTYFAYLSDIASRGIVPNMGSSMGGAGLESHKKGRVFATAHDGVSFWYGRSEEWAFDGYDDWAEIGLVPVVLRFPDEHGDIAEEDEPGSGDSGADAWMIPGEIVDEIEFYLDGKWHPIEHFEIINIAAALDDGSMKSDYENPLFPSDLVCWCMDR